MATTIQGIASSSDKADALVYLSNQLPSDAESIGAYLEAARTISASRSTSPALRSLPLADFDTENYRTLLDVVGQISSSSDKREVLEHIASQSGLPPSIAPYYLDAVAHIASSSDRKDSVLELLAYAKRRGDSYTQSDRLKERTLQTIETIPSAGDREECLRAVIETYS
jgi:hypothetical protein